MVFLYGIIDKALRIALFLYLKFVVFCVAFRRFYQERQKIY